MSQRHRWLFIYLLSLFKVCILLTTCHDECLQVYLHKIFLYTFPFLPVYFLNLLILKHLIVIGKIQLQTFFKPLEHILVHFIFCNTYCYIFYYDCPQDCSFYHFLWNLFALFTWKSLKWSSLFAPSFT